MRCQSDANEDTSEVADGGDLGIVGDDVQDFGDASFPSAPGVDTTFVFPKNTPRCKSSIYNFQSSQLFLPPHQLYFDLLCFSVVTAGEESELLVGVNNQGN